MNDLWCPVCKKLRLGPGHTCDPIWECNSEDPRGEHGEFEGTGRVGRWKKKRQCNSMMSWAYIAETVR